MAYSKKDKAIFLDLLMKKNGNISKACIAMNLPRMNFYSWLKIDKWFAEKYQELQEAEIDDAEDTLRMLRKGVPEKDENGKIIGWLVRPDVTANIFFLKTKGKKRGYIESSEQSNFVRVEMPDIIIERKKDEKK